MTPVANPPAGQQACQGYHHQQLNQRHPALAINIIENHLVVHGGQCNQEHSRIKTALSDLKRAAQPFYETDGRNQQNAMRNAETTTADRQK
jgi:hypothetical protein